MMIRQQLCVLVFTVVAGGDVSKLPSSFEWGTATAAYQIEGAAFEDGRGLSIWDTFSHEKGKTFHGETGDVADDFYHRFQADIELMRSLGLEYYRMSLSWSRLLPDGTTDNVNRKGVDFYISVFETLETYGITPLVTLYHWDFPQALESKYDGWLSRDSVEDFANYADFAFQTFAPYVDKWITFNEALTFIGEGYTDGIFAPGRCADRSRCDQGDSVTEPYLAAHHVLLAHGLAVQRFRAAKYKGEIGMTNCGWMMWPLEPENPKPAQDLMEAQWAWFTDPITFGDYPESMKQRAGRNLPVFTPDESAMLRNSIDFLGVNYYSARYVTTPDSSSKHPPAVSASGVPMINNDFSLLTENDDGVPLGPQGGSDWLYVVPHGLHDLLLWLDDRYHDVKMRITENGCSQPVWLDETKDLAVNDTFRLSYLQSHINAVADAVLMNNVNVVGYYAWSFLDNYEWADGYGHRFGIVYVDFDTQIRTPKLSAFWYSQLIESHHHHHHQGTPRFVRRHARRIYDLRGILLVSLFASVVVVVTAGLVHRSHTTSSSSSDDEHSSLLHTASQKRSSLPPPPTPRIGRRIK